MNYPRRLLIATTNPKKRTEMQQILGQAQLDIEIVTLQDFPDAPEVEETGSTFMENSHLKAHSAAKHSGLVVIADDGGLSIDALGGAPGVHSSRFLGVETSFKDKMEAIFQKMENTPPEERTCRFQCAVVIATPAGEAFECMGTCEGRVGYERKGDFGFGYDPLFVLPDGRHMAELMPQEKHTISHRGRALACATEALRKIFPS